MVEEAEQLPAAEANTRLFISYSRKDMNFVDGLEAALRARGFEPLVDRTEISAFEPWWERVEALIAGADTIVFVLSPDAVASTVALKEIEYAASLHKRFAPIVCRPVEDANIPQELRRLNFVYFDDPNRFKASVDALATAVGIDIGWVRRHTEFGESARRWVAAKRPSGFLLRSPLLEEAEHWIKYRPHGAPAPSPATETFVAESRKAVSESLKAEAIAKTWRRRAQAAIYVLLIGIIVGLVAWINQEHIREQWNWYAVMRPYMLKNIRPYVLQADAERRLMPGESFRECLEGCPEMIVVPAGVFTMGASAAEYAGADAVLVARSLYSNAEPQHGVQIVRPFAVSKFVITFANWDACVSVGGCAHITDNGMGRDSKPLVNVTWNEAEQYVSWLSKLTGRDYRLLSEAEWEYAARAGATTSFYWGKDVGSGNANCIGCGSKWDGRETSPVGSFAANRFGLFDMAGNIWQWTQDCYQDNYIQAPIDGTARRDGDCSFRVLRGGSWSHPPDTLRLFFRDKNSRDKRSDRVGFRIGRTLAP